MRRLALLVLLVIALAAPLLAEGEAVLTGDNPISTFVQSFVSQPDVDLKGEDARAFFRRAGMPSDGMAGDFVKNATGFSKKGSVVTITSAKKASYQFFNDVKKPNGTIAHEPNGCIHLDTTVTFTIAPQEKGVILIDPISGIKVSKLKDSNKATLKRISFENDARGQPIAKATGSWFIFSKTVTIDLSNPVGSATTAAATPTPSPTPGITNSIPR